MQTRIFPPGVLGSLQQKLGDDSASSAFWWGGGVAQNASAYVSLQPSNTLPLVCLSHEHTAAIWDQ